MTFTQRKPQFATIISRKKCFQDTLPNSCNWFFFLESQQSDSKHSLQQQSYHTCQCSPSSSGNSIPKARRQRKSIPHITTETGTPSPKICKQAMKRLYTNLFKKPSTRDFPIYSVTSRLRHLPTLLKKYAQAAAGISSSLTSALNSSMYRCPTY